MRSLRVEVINGPDAGKLHTAQADTITIGSGQGNDLVLTDGTVSRYHLEVQRIDQKILVQDHGSTNGTKLGAIGLDRGTVPPGSVLELGRTSLRIDDGETVEFEVLGEDRLGRVRGRSPSMRRLMATAKRAARTDASMLLLGETGTGKEVMAHAIHEASLRARMPFETVDCGSLMPTLVASELFGHEKGAFTGADRQHVGAFERANGGTLFLDEIGELPMPLQANLLGALERRSFRRVGGHKSISVDVRVLCATHRDLRAEVNKGNFREDLYYRIAVLLLRIPPLRERADDIPLLVEHFLSDEGYAGDVASVIPKAVMQQLQRHHWPGNVRELRNFVEAALAMGEAPPIEAQAGAAQAQGEGPRVQVSDLEELDYKDARDEVMREFQIKYLTALMKRCRGNVAMAARQANMDRTYLMQLLKRLGLRDTR